MLVQGGGCKMFMLSICRHGTVQGGRLKGRLESLQEIVPLIQEPEGPMKDSRRKDGSSRLIRVKRNQITGSCTSHSAPQKPPSLPWHKSKVLQKLSSALCTTGFPINFIPRHQSRITAVSYFLSLDKASLRANTNII